MSTFTIPEVCTQVVSRVDMRLTPHISDIFRFTLYWTLLIDLFLFGLPGLWALLVHLLPRRRGTPGGTALRRIPSTPRYHNTHSYAVLEDVPSHSPAFSPSPHPSSADVQGATQAGTLGHLRFAEPQPSTLVSPVSSPAPSQGWDSWTPSIRLRNLRSRPINTVTPQDHHESVSTSVPPPPTPLTPFSLSYIPASRPTSFFIPIPGTNSATTPLARPSASNAPIQPPLRLSRFRKPAKANLLLVLLIPLVFVLVGALIGVSGSLVIGYLLAALRDCSNVKISTWLPLGWAVIQGLVVFSG